MKTKIKDKIRAVIFDSNGVLQLGEHPKGIRGHYSIGVHSYMARKFKVDLDSWFDAIDTPYAMSIEGKQTTVKTLSIMSKNLKTNPAKIRKYFKKAYKKYFRKNRRLYRMAFKLKKKGYKIGILSDQWCLSKEILLPKKDYKDFDLVMVSGDIGLRKPGMPIYKLLIKKLKLKPNEILFIDNRDYNLKVPKKLGMKTILFKDNKQFFKEIRKLGIEL